MRRYSGKNMDRRFANFSDPPPRQNEFLETSSDVGHDLETSSRLSSKAIAFRNSCAGSMQSAVMRCALLLCAASPTGALMSAGYAAKSPAPRLRANAAQVEGLAEVATHSTAAVKKARLHVRLDDVWYDLTAWRAAHPAGYANPRRYSRPACQPAHVPPHMLAPSHPMCRSCTLRTAHRAQRTAPSLLTRLTFPSAARTGSTPTQTQTRRR